MLEMTRRRDFGRPTPTAEVLARCGVSLFVARIVPDVWHRTFRFCRGSGARLAGNPSAEQIGNDTVDDVDPGLINLLHVMLESLAASRAAVRQIVDRLRADGYRIVIVSGLLTLRPALPLPSSSPIQP